MGQHSGWQPQPFDWRAVALFYAFVALLVAASACPRRMRRALARPAPCCCCTRRGSKGRRECVPGWAHVSSGEAILVFMLLSIMGLAFGISWDNMHAMANEPDAPFLTSYTHIKVSLVTRCIGHVNEAQISLALLPVTRNSVWLHGLAVPFEHAIKYHRLLGRLAIGLMTVHMALWWGVWVAEKSFLANAFLQAGYVATPAPNLADPTVPYVEAAWLLAVCLASLQLVRRTNFELFYYAHHLMLVVVGVVAFHSWFAGGYICYLLIGPVLLYIVDRVIRHRRSRSKTIMLSLKPLPGATLVRYQLAHLAADSVRAGQYAFVNVPELSSLQWHPLSYSSVSYEEAVSRATGKPLSVATAQRRITVTHHVKDMGPGTWSGQLRQLAESATYSSGFSPGSTMAGVRVCSDGPYGTSFNGVDLSVTDTLVLVGGGIGATPLMAALNELVHNDAIFAATTKLRRVELLWVVRQPELFAWFEPLLEEARAVTLRAAEASTRGLEFHISLFATCRDSGLRGHAASRASLPSRLSNSGGLATDSDGSAHLRLVEPGYTGRSARDSPASRHSGGKRASRGRGGLRAMANPLLHAASDGRGHSTGSSDVHDSGDSAGSPPVHDDHNGARSSQPYTVDRPDVRAFFRDVLHRRDDAGLRGTLGTPRGPGAPPAPMVRAQNQDARAGVVLSTGEPGGVSVWTSGPCALMEEVEVQARCVLGHCCSDCKRSEFVL